MDRLSERLTVHDLMTLFNHSAEDADRWLTGVDNAEWMNVLCYLALRHA